MTTELRFEFVWVPSSLGGHSGVPYEGMRMTIRWQKHLNEFLQCARDVQCENIEFDSGTGQGSATCKFISGAPLPDDWIKDGELIELLSGFRVLAVGRLGVAVT